MMDKKGVFVENVMGAIYKLYFEIGQTIIKVRCSSKSGSGRHSMILPAGRASVIHRNIRVFMKFHNAFLFHRKLRPMKQK